MVAEYGELLARSFSDYANYFVRELTHPGAQGYLTWLILISAMVYGWELLRPWRKSQPRLRRDFWLDAFTCSGTSSSFP